MSAAEEVDVVVIGAGPAGIGAALSCVESGASVVVLDEQAAAGGQIYRGIERATPHALRILGPDYSAGKQLVNQFSAAGVRFEGGASVWEVTKERAIRYVQHGRSRCIQGRRIVIASGAIERPFPISGWTLPGVLTIGAGQILLKNGATAPSQPVVLAGCGPLLYLLGVQYLRAGVPVKGIVDTTADADYVRALPYVFRALGAPSYLKKGFELLRAIREKGIPHYRNASGLQVEGKDRAEGIRFNTAGVVRELRADVVLLHQGVVPNTQLTWLLRASHRWDEQQLCWVPVTGEWGELDVAGFFVAGDGQGIVGAEASFIQGTLTGLAVARQLNYLSESDFDRRTVRPRRELARHLRVRPLLHALYRPKDENRLPSDEVVVCRCEGVLAGDIRRYVALGCLGPNQAKAFGRCGMGACQGRLCGLTVTETIAAARGVAPAEVGYYRIRPPIKPLTLGELAREGTS